MKICYLSAATLPSQKANAIQVMKMCEAFSALGNEVELIAPDRRDDTLREENVFNFYGVEPIFSIRKLPWAEFPGRGWVYGYRTARAAARSQPDLVYARDLRGCAFAASRGFPCVFESHSMRPLRQIGQTQAFRYLSRNPKLLFVVAISNALASDIAASFPGVQERIHVAHDAASPVSPSAKLAELPGRPDSVKVGYVGQFYQGRGVEFILRLAAACPWADFHLIGGNSHALKSSIEGTAIPSNLYLHGFVPPDKTTNYRLACDILIAPYSTEIRTELTGGDETSRWASPLKLFEYMAVGRPIVCADLPVFHEVLQHEETCLFAPPDDLAAWTQVLQRLRSSSELCARLGHRAQQHFLKEHSWAQRATRILGWTQKHQKESEFF